MSSNDQLPPAASPEAGSTPRLNHLNLCTSDVGALSTIFTRHFAFTTLVANDASAMLRGSDGFLLVLTKIDQRSPPTYPNSFLLNMHISFHVGFRLDAPAQVYAKHQELREAGWQPKPVQTFEALSAAWTAFYCPLGDGIDLEVNAHVLLPAGPPAGA